MAHAEIFNKVISAITDNTKKPEDFLSVQNAVAANLRNTMKRLYDFTKEETGRDTDALPELLTDGFDEEQIWQQLELQNEAELIHFLNGISKFLAGSKGLDLPISTSKPERAKNKGKASDTVESSQNIDSEEEEVEEDEEDQELKDDSKKVKQIKRSNKKSIVDDKFFKLQELSEYLSKEEKREKQNKKDTDQSDEEDDDSLDLFNDLSEDEEDDTEDAKFLKYADFFDNPNSEDEGTDKESSFNNRSYNIDKNEEEELLDDSGSEYDEKDDLEPKSSTKRVKFNLTNDSDETDSLENKAEVKETNTEVKSSLETRQERLQKRIHELEEEAIAEKPWQLKGEVNASLRPPNSLLEEYVEFDVTTRPAPVITEQTTLKLEDIIKQRIKDKAWDDVEKKFKPVETPLEYKKKLILNQEKSKESLSQIYEKEYLKQKEGANPESKEVEEEEPKAHIEIREAMQSLFSKLDALANFHYTPKLAQPEIKIISNIPAINMEEVAPVATSDAALLAPEEIKEKPRGEFMDKSERTATDMKRERRKKKLRQKEKQKNREKQEKLNTMKPEIGKKYKKDKNLLLMKKLSKDRNITTVDETNSTIPKSSTAFFSQLQDQVKSHIKSKANLASKQKSKKSLSAVKLKL